MHLKVKKNRCDEETDRKMNMYRGWTTNEKLNDFKLNVLNQIKNNLSDTDSSRVQNNTLYLHVVQL